MGLPNGGMALKPCRYATNSRYDGAWQHGSICWSAKTSGISLNSLPCTLATVWTEPLLNLLGAEWALMDPEQKL